MAEGSVKSRCWTRRRLPRRRTRVAAAERSTAMRAATARPAPPAGSPGRRREDGRLQRRVDPRAVTLVMSYFENQRPPRSPCSSARRG